MSFLDFPFFKKNPDLPPAPPGLDAAGLLKFVFQEVSPLIKAGMVTRTIESYVQDLTKGTGANLYFRGYRGYPSIVSTPVNEEIVHAPPSARILRAGDLVSLEFGLELKGAYAFAAKTFPVGAILQQDAALLLGCQTALNKGIDAVRPGCRVGNISGAIQQELDRNQLIPCREFVGYQIGSKPQMPPQIPCYHSGPEDRGLRLQEGMKLAILVIAHAEIPSLKVRSDGWTVHDVHGKNSAYFASMVEVTASGCNILV